MVLNILDTGGWIRIASVADEPSQAVAFPGTPLRVYQHNYTAIMRDVLDESGEVSDDTQPVVSAKLEIEALGTQIVSRKALNTKEDVQTYLDMPLMLVSVKGPTYIIDRTYTFIAVVVGMEEKHGTGGDFSVGVLIALNDAMGTVRIAGKITATQYKAPKGDIIYTNSMLLDRAQPKRRNSYSSSAAHRTARSADIAGYSESVLCFASGSP